MTYDYRSKAHRDWRNSIVGDAGCYICGRNAVGPRGGRGRGKRHAHHLHGTDCLCGVELCATCHKLVTLFTHAAKAIWFSQEMFDRLCWVVNEWYAGHQPDKT